MSPYSPLILLKKISRYLLSGGSATLLHWGVMASLMAVGVSPNTATALGALAGACLNYWLQFHFTFRTDNAHLDTIPRYLLITLLSWCANNALFAAIHGFTSWTVVHAQLVTTGCVMALNFVMYQRYVFNERNRVSLGSGE